LCLRRDSCHLHCEVMYPYKLHRNKLQTKNKKLPNDSTTEMKINIDDAFSKGEGARGWFQNYHLDPDAPRSIRLSWTENGVYIYLPSSGYHAQFPGYFPTFHANQSSKKVRQRKQEMHIFQLFGAPRPVPPTDNGCCQVARRWLSS
jgi:hypothetical protein